KKPVKPPVVQPGSGNNIIINPCQRLNPVLECIRNVGKEFGEILPDFQVGRTTGVLFLSLRYHRLHPEYIHQRIEALGQSYNLRILLLMCDISEHQEHIRELTKICMINNLTIIIAWSADEAGQYLAIFKQFEHKPPDLIRERVERSPAALMRAALTSISKVNKTDVETLRTSFGSMAGIARATSDQLAQLPGFGPKKVARMKDAFERPFRNNATSALTSEPSVPEATSLPSSSTLADPSANKDNGKGKGKEKEKENPAPIAGPSTVALPGSGRAESPPWDIELDLNSPTPPPPPSSQPRTQAQPKPKPQNPTRAESPIWDIELDLNSPEPE
ncbi:DNA repair protein rad10, partial [Dentipellis sp. KUC8613]